MPHIVKTISQLQKNSFHLIKNVCKGFCAKAKYYFDLSSHILCLLGSAKKIDKLYFPVPRIHNSIYSPTTCVNKIKPPRCITHFNLYLCIVSLF